MSQPSLCSNCGAPLSPDESTCRQCGHARPPMADQGDPDANTGLSPFARNVLLAISVTLLVLVGLPAMLMGACFLVMGGLSAGSSGPLNSDGLIGFLGLAVFGLLLWAVIALSRRK